MQIVPRGTKEMTPTDHAAPSVLDIAMMSHGWASADLDRSVAYVHLHRQAGKDLLKDWVQSLIRSCLKPIWHGAEIFDATGSRTAPPTG